MSHVTYGCDVWERGLTGSILDFMIDITYPEHDYTDRSIQWRSRGFTGCPWILSHR